ncbi:classical arabinogalactan protein 9-like [Rana temporaria]|uniref:classical arabinogalactan protein 9-like n=1 Tax=Rana temporaria TaxID=8407 RepID=UPI001AACE718|nr:classical arabinogalactan protein 9-like [Rana temporaria]
MQEPSEVGPMEQNLPPHAMETTAQELPPNYQDVQAIYPTSRSPAPPGNLAPPPYPTTSSMPGGQPPVMYNTAYPATQVVTAQPPGTYPAYYSSVPANLTQQQPVYTPPMAPQPHYPPTNMPPYPITTAPGPHPQYQYQPPPYPTATDFGYQQPYPVYQATNAPMAATQPFVGMASRPKDYLCWSILSMIFCVCPLGLGAVIFSRKTSDAVAKQDWISARRYSSTALMFNVVSLMFGVVCYFGIISFSIVRASF